MKYWFILILLINLSCSAYHNTRSFNIQDSQDRAAWSRANVALFNYAGYSEGYNFFTVNDYIIYSHYNTFKYCYVTRMKHNNNNIYTVCVSDRADREEMVESILDDLQEKISGIKIPAKKQSANTFPDIPEKASPRAAPKKLRDGVYIWE